MKNSSSDYHPLESTNCLQLNVLIEPQQSWGYFHKIIVLINIICQPRHKNKSGVPTGSIRRGQLLHTSATHPFGEIFKENTSADVFAIYFIKSFFFFLVRLFLRPPCTLDTDTVSAHASFTDCDLALRHTALEQREAPRMESVSWIAASAGAAAET